MKERKIEDLVINWENEFDFLKNEIPKNSDLIITLFILKFRQSEESDIEYRKYLVEMILNNEILLIFNESSKNEIIHLLDEIIEKNDDKAKILIEILLYFFKIKISISDSELDDYFPIMKFIIDAIDGDESKINFIVYPYITRIYASAFYQKYLELFLEVKINDNQQIKVSGFKSLFQYRKRLWQFSQNFMLKYLYFVVAKEDYSKFNEIYKK